MFQLWQVPAFLATGFAAGFVDSIAGGGGLITMPVLLSAGFSPLDALGTNKLQATFGSGSATWHYTQAGAVSPRDCRRGFIITFIAAAAGTLLVRQLSADFLKRFIPILLLVVAVYFLFRPNLGERESPPRMSRVKFDVVFGMAIGFYDGFFGPGTGTFWAMAFVLVLGFQFTRATGETKVMNFASNLSSLLCFLPGGHVVLWAGATMGVGQWIGARLGSRTVVKHGARFIRPIFIAVVLGLTLKLLYEVYVR